MTNTNPDKIFASAEQVLPDLESLLYLPGWELSDGLQLSRGQLKTVSLSAAIGQVKVLFNSPSATILDKGIYDGDYTAVGMVVGGAQTPRYFGPIDLEDTLIVWRQGKMDFHEYTIPKQCVDLTVMIPTTLADVMGWNLNAPYLRVESSEQIKYLVDACLAAVRFCKSDGQSAPDRAGVRIIAALDSVLEGAQADTVSQSQLIPKSQSYELLADATRILESHVAASPMPLRVDRMAERLGVSRRSLFSNFRMWLGVGPQRYLTLLRLHELRRRLLGSDTFITTVRAEALKLGFSHLGRLSGDYRELFGEPPSETLARMRSSK